MSTASQDVFIKSHLTGQVIWQGTATRNTIDHPLTTEGQASFEAALEAGTFAITASNGGVVPAGTRPTLTIPAPPAVTAPTGLTATSAGSTQINLAWTAVMGASGYLVERSTTGTSGWTQVGTPSVASFNDTGLTVNTAYYYRIRATNSGGTSGYSSTANATTTASFAAYEQTVPGPTDRFIYPTGGSPTSTDLPFTGVPKTDTNYAFSLVYQTNEGSPGQGGIKVGSGSVQATFGLEVASGGTRTITGTLSLAAGNNTVTFVVTSGTLAYQVRSLTITRAAGA